jgi:ABC-2 type transport system permease protein
MTLAIGMNGFLTLLYKELLRFWKVGFQTVLAPMLSTLLYLLIFSHALEERVQAYPGITYTVFLIPGLVIMAMLQNAFANSSSSLIQSTVSGNHVFMLLSPLSYQEIFMAYVLASVVRGLLVGLGIHVMTLGFFELPLYSFPWVFIFALMGTALLGALGIIAGIWAEKFEQLAALQNFVILPLTFLSGVFYTIPSLPPFWQGVSYLNPFFYIVDGFRYGFFRTSDIPPYLSLGTLTACFLAVSWLTLRMLKTGYKIRQ